MNSPCKNICTFDKFMKACSGCGRTLDEIAMWKIYTDDEREYHVNLARRRLKRFSKENNDD